MTPDTELDDLFADLLLTNAGPAYDEIRGVALQRLLEIGDAAYHRLVEMASVAEPRPNVLAALAEFGRAESVPVLSAALTGASDPTTVTAAFALADIPGAAAFDALVDALRSDREQTVRSAALGLGHRGDPEGVPILAAIAATAPASLRDAFAEALSELGS